MWGKMGNLCSLHWHADNYATYTTFQCDISSHGSDQRELLWFEVDVIVVV